MDTPRRFKIKLALIGFAPSLVFAVAVVLLLSVLVDFSSLSVRALSLLACALLILLIPLSICFDKRWQKPLVERVARYLGGHPLSEDEVHDIHRMGLRFPILTYFLNLVWWLTGVTLGSIWLHFNGLAGLDILFLVLTSLAAGMMCALVQFYAVKSFLWKTLATIVSAENQGEPRYVDAPLAIRSKLLLSFLSVIIPALICSNLLATSMIFDTLRDHDVKSMTNLGRDFVAELRSYPHGMPEAASCGTQLEEHRKRVGLQIPMALYDKAGEELFSDSPFPLPQETLKDILDEGVDQSFRIGRKATVLCLFLGDEGPLLALVSPSNEHSAGLTRIRWVLSFSSLILFLSLVVVTFLASRDISGPLRTLTEQASEVARGKLDTEVSVFSEDEIGEMGWALRQMKDSLIRSNQALEAKVSERTSEMQRANNDLKKEIAERKRAEEGLRRSEQKLSFHIRQTPLAFIELDTHLQVTDWNPSAEEIFGYSREEAMGRNAADLIVPEHNKDLMDFDWSGLKKFEGGVRTTTPNTTKDGRQLVCDWYNTPLMDEGGEIIGLASLAEDVTDRKQWEEQLKAAKEKAESSDKAKSEFLANMSHEIRTPLNGVIGMTGLLLETELTPEQYEYAETIRTSADSLLSLVNDILDFSKIEAGQLDLELLDFDLRATIEDVTDMLAIKAQDKGLELSCLIHPDVPSLVRGDPGRLRQVLINLTGNAIKFTERGAVHIQTILTEETEDRVTVRFSITDTGIGIPRNSLDRLFQTFSQVDSSITRRYGGTGLGLAISKQLTEMMGGQIGVESEEGKGSTFWCDVVLEKQIGSQSIKWDLPEDVRGTRILVVDDYSTNRLVVRELLDSWGCRFDEAVDGAEALEKLRQARSEQDPFRIALVDMQMPVMDGKTLGAKIKTDPLLCDTLLVMLTSVGMRGEAAQLQEIGFDAYLIKPIRISQLYDCLVTVLGSSSRVSRRPDRPIITRHSLREDKKRKIRILVAEDNVVNQKVALRILTKLGYHADAVANGREAVKALETIPYDLVLMDVQMPELDGFEATRIIRDPTSRVGDHKIPIVAMTAHAMKGDRERCLEEDMDDYISKPVTPMALNEILEKHLKTATALDVSGQEPEVPEQEPVQIRRIQEITDGDGEFERELIESFLLDTEEHLLAIESAILEEDRAKVRQEAHGMKGSSANAGAKGLQEIACRLEQIGITGRLAEALELMPSLKAEFELVRNYLQAYLDSRGASSSDLAKELQ